MYLPISKTALIAPNSFQDVLERYAISSDELHPVARLIIDRAKSPHRPEGGFPDGNKLGLVVEGGAMRGIVSLGMLVLLEQMGATEVFDDVYGSSAGAINSAFFIGRQAGMAATVYYNEMITSGFVSYRRYLAHKPIVSLEYLLDKVVEIDKPLDWDGVANSHTRLHPVAFSTTRLEAVDLAPLATKADVKEALRASARVPIFAGAPVSFRGDTYFDATMTTSIPYEDAIESGCSHVLVLRTRPEGSYRSSPSLLERVITEPGLRKLDPRLLEIFRARAASYAKEADDLAKRAASLDGEPSVLQITPQVTDPTVGSLSRSRDAVLLSAMIGMKAASRVLLHRECRPLEELRAFYS